MRSNLTGNGSRTASDAIVVDQTTHYFDLAASVLKGNLVYKSGYSAREEYGMANLSPESWEAVVVKAATKSPDGDRIFRQFRYVLDEHLPRLFLDGLK